MPLHKPSLPAELEICLKGLNSYRKKRREEALAAARQLPTEQLVALIAGATGQIRKIGRRDWIFYLPFWIVLGMPTAAMLLTLLHGFIAFDPNKALGAVLLPTVGIPLAAWLYNAATSPVNRYMALSDLIAEREEPCLLGSALDMSIWRALTMSAIKHVPRNSLYLTIERLVMRMEPGDYADLTTQQKRTLLRWLHNPVRNLNLSLALLEVLKTVSDKSAMDRVAKLALEGASAPRHEPIRKGMPLFQPADRQFSLPLREKLKPLVARYALKHAEKQAEQEELARKRAQIRKAAQVCLDAMQRMLAQEQQAQRLLRASDAHTHSAPKLLLRPASGTTVASAPDQLLRASDADTHLICPQSYSSGCVRKCATEEAEVGF